MSMVTPASSPYVLRSRDHGNVLVDERGQGHGFAAAVLQETPGGSAPAACYSGPTRRDDAIIIRCGAKKAKLQRVVRDDVCHGFEKRGAQTGTATVREQTRPYTIVADKERRFLPACRRRRPGKRHGVACHKSG
jgi:hypothetical protein